MRYADTYCGTIPQESPTPPSIDVTLIAPIGCGPPTSFAASSNQSAGLRHHPTFWLAAHTGMRRSEILGVRWNQVDLDASRLSVCRSVVSIGYEVHESPGKTRNSRRTVDGVPSEFLLANPRTHRIVSRISITEIILFRLARVYCQDEFFLEQAVCPDRGSGRVVSTTGTEPPRRVGKPPRRRQPWIAVVPRLAVRR